jgi:hypothetical protein
MNYEKLYNNIISNAKHRSLKRQIGFHIHHILMKCLGGTNDKENLVSLTYKEHFVCHHLLYKILKNESAANAWFKMLCSNYASVNITATEYSRMMHLCWPKEKRERFPKRATKTNLLYWTNERKSKHSAFMKSVWAQRSVEENDIIRNKATEKIKERYSINNEYKEKNSLSVKKYWHNIKDADKQSFKISCSKAQTERYKNDDQRLLTSIKGKEAWAIKKKKQQTAMDAGFFVNALYL